MNELGRTAAGVASLLLVACGGAQVPAPPNVGYGYAAHATGGVYNDGSGKLGVAVLSTLRDAAGAGPAGPWGVSLRDAAGPIPVTASYGVGGPGSYASWWWPGIAARSGEYMLAFADGTRSLSVSFQIGGAGMELPTLGLSSDAAKLSWPAVPSAVAYSCRIYTGSSLQLALSRVDPDCDLTSLPPGAYTASVLAFSGDPETLAATVAQDPALPPRFDVSEARMAFVRPQPGAPALKVLASGGALDYGSSLRGLAVWVSLTNADGTPTATAWSIAIAGPGIPSSSPLTFTYTASRSRDLVWSYDVPATPGLYSLTASSGATSVAASFSVGDPVALPLPGGVLASSTAGAGASVDWQPVVGAKSYFVGAWTQSTPQAPTSRFVAGKWVAGPPAAFAAGTFVASTAYDVYVAATDTDMTGLGAAPTQVAVSENTFNPASFTAR